MRDRPRETCFIRPQNSVAPGNVAGLGDGGVPGRVPRLFELRAARHSRDANLLDRVRIGRTQRAEDIRVELEHGGVAACDDRRRARRRRSAATSRRSSRPPRSPRPPALGLEHDARPRPSRRRTSTGPGSPCANDRLAVAVKPSRRPRPRSRGAAPSVRRAKRSTRASTASRSLLLRRRIWLGPLARVPDLDRPRDLDAVALRTRRRSRSAPRRAPRRRARSPRSRSARGR